MNTDFNRRALRLIAAPAIVALIGVHRRPILFHLASSGDASA
jgi:hypothetical protein